MHSSIILESRPRRPFKIFPESFHARALNFKGLYDLLDGIALLQVDQSIGLKRSASLFGSRAPGSILDPSSCCTRGSMLPSTSHLYRVKSYRSSPALNFRGSGILCQLKRASELGQEADWICFKLNANNGTADGWSGYLSSYEQHPEVSVSRQTSFDAY